MNATTRPARVLCAALTIAALRPSIADAAPGRWAVIVGSNVEVLGRNPLRYAHDDAKQLSRALIDLGDFEERNVRLLLDPRPQEVLAALDALMSKAANEPDGMILFYYSGHADTSSLFPDGAPLPLSEVKKRLEDERVGLRVGIVDACRGGGWTGTKGFTTDAPFEVETQTKPRARGTVFVASSSGDQSAHESETLAGSFFTHHLVAGLRGAADDDADGVIALSEVYRYARRRTVRDAAIYAEGEQHPSFRVTLSGRQDVSLTWVERGRSTLALGPRRSALQIIDLDSGVTAVELPPGERAVKLALDEGQYVLRRRDEAGATRVREIELKAGDSVSIRERELLPTGVAALREKSAESDAFDDRVGEPAPNVALHQASPPAPPPIGPSGVRVRLIGEPDEQTTFYLRGAHVTGPVSLGGQAGFVAINGYAPVCTAPCEATLPPGVNMFALSRGLSRRIVAADPIAVGPDMTLKGEYTDNSPFRFLGYSIMALSLATAAGFGIAALTTETGDPGSPGFSDAFDKRTQYAAIGVSTGIIGTAIGLVVALLSKDRAEVSHAP